MKPAPFEYYTPATVAEAVGLLAEHGDDAKVIAGGQSLVPMLNLRLTRFEALVDVGKIGELRAIDVDAEGATVGATVAQCEVEHGADIAAAAPLLARATPHIGHFQIRSRGTVGGSIAHADPAAEYPAVALALDAEVQVAGPGGTRTIPAADFFDGMWTTTLEPDELLTAIRFPTWGSASGFAVEEVARRHGDFAIAGACAGVELDGDRIGRVAVGLFGLASTPLRAGAAERELVGQPADAVDVEAFGHAAVADLDPPGDLHASTALRRRVGAAVTGRALQRALEEAIGA